MSGSLLAELTPSERRFVLVQRLNQVRRGHV
jgi:hypothetical protein